MQQRQFTSGSRQAPDPYDQFLEEHQYYRKHTARDASCLFRVISEQMYDTQLHHLVIREKCVTYMRKHRKFFEHLVDRDFDEYLDDMSKPKTYGTLLELQAAGYLFQRNVILFEPFNLGNYFKEYRSYFKDNFRVFHTPERHFDSVFTSEYIQEAAICQSICYEILYKDLFKLPDVSFAVEQMLHGSNFESTEYSTEINQDGYATRLYLNDGREFELDLPHNTKCILDNYKLCHFHYTNFPRFSDDLQRELKVAHSEDNEKNSVLIQRTAESFLPNKYMSCVRQLLQETITPFPYKVAKALDPNMYRNIEFDSWNEMRKELKLQNWYNGDSNFKVGAKCHVKLRKSEQDLYTCHIQEIAVDKGQCIVFVEQLGEKRLVPYENLTPLPPDQFKPWTVPFRYQRQKFSTVRYTRQFNYRYKFDGTTEHHHHQFHQHFCGSGSGMDNDSSCCSKSDYINEDDPKRQHHHYHHHYRHHPNHQCVPAAAASYYKMKQYTHLENFRTQTVEFCTMPLTVEHNGGGGGGGEGGGGEPAKGNRNQERDNDSNENSRSTPRSANTNNNALNEGSSGGHAKGGGDSSGVAFTAMEDHLVPHTVGYAVPHPHGDGIYDMEHYNPIYMSDYQSLYPMYPYPPVGALPDDYYGGYCGYDIHAPATFMSAVNNVNGYFYVYGNGPGAPGSFMSTAAGNQFIAAPQPIGIPPPAVQNLPVFAPIYGEAPPPSGGRASTNSPSVQNTGGSASFSTGSNTQQSSVPPQHSPSPRLRRTSNQNRPTTPSLSTGAVNFDAKKSNKEDGVDLPADVATLKFFYNLGLDYYQQLQAKSSTESNEPSKTSEVNETEKLANDLQNIRLDENANQVTNTAVKSDANNNTLVPESAQNTATDKLPVPQNNGNKTSTLGNAPTTGGGNKNNNRRYNSRYFSGKDRQMQHQQQRNQSNSNFHVPYTSHQHHNHPHHHQQQQHQPNQVLRNHANSANHKSGGGGQANVGNGGGYQTSTTPNSSRNVPTQHGPPPPLLPHPPQLQPHVAMTEHSVQTSPMCGFDDAFMGGRDSNNCNTPTSNNSTANPIHQYGTYGNEQINDGMCGPFGVPLAATASGVFVPMPMTATSGPPPPYGLYASHPPPPGYQTAAAGMHPNFVNGPLHLAPPPVPPGVANSTTSGSDTTETNGICNSGDMMNNNGLVAVGSGGLGPLQCTSYPPPPIPYYYASGAVPPPGIGGGHGGPNAGVNGGGVHLITQMPAPTPTNHSMTQSFTTPHPPMGQQGYFCLPPPSHSQQMPTPQQMQQQQHPSPMTNNRDTVASANNNGGVTRPDMSTTTNE